MLLSNRIGNIMESNKKQEELSLSQSKSDKLFPKLKHLFVEWCKSSSSHGIPNIASTDNLLIRLIWIVCFCISLGYCSILLIQTLFDYLANPVYINIQVIEDIPTLFPAISICNLNPFRTDDPAIKAEFDYLVSQNNLSTANGGLLFYLDSSSKLIKSYVSRFNVEKKKSYGHELKDMLLDCRFNADICTHQDFEWFYDFDYGNCYKFNADSKKFVSVSGSRAGLLIELIIKNHSSSEPFILKTGVRFLIHNQSLALPLVLDYGSDAMPGQFTQVKIKRNIFQKLSSPYSDCIEDLSKENPKKSYLMEAMFNFLNYTQYSRDICRSLCFQIELFKSCNCFDPSIPQISNVKASECIKPYQLMCQDRLFANMSSKNNNTCEQYCPKECVTYDYLTEISSSSFMTKWFWNLTKQSIVTSNLTAISVLDKIGLRDKLLSIDTFEQAKENVLALNFYYSELSYRKVSEIPVWTVSSFMSSIGGNLGLFVGISMLSLIEIVDIAIQFINATILHLKQTKKF